MNVKLQNESEGRKQRDGSKGAEAKGRKQRGGSKGTVPLLEGIKWLF